MKDEPPIIDLHESQWDRKGKRQPFWGPNAGQFLIYAISMPIAYWIVSTIVSYFRY